MAKNGENDVIIIEDISTETLEIPIVGMSPLIMNRFSHKAKREIIQPEARKTRTEKDTVAKHNPIEEYRDAMHQIYDGPTRIALPAMSIKGAMGQAALNTKGAQKTQVGRLVHVLGEYVPLYGIPTMSAMLARNTNIDRTPRIAIRPIFMRWAAVVPIRFVVPNMPKESVVNLLSAAGSVCGVGDWRPDRKGSYGLFRIAQFDDPEFQEIVDSGGWEQQNEAIETPIYYDDDSRELIEWQKEQVKRRGLVLPQHFTVTS